MTELPSGRGARSLLREPLVHFLLLGLLVFGADTLLAGDGERAEQIPHAASPQADGVATNAPATPPPTATITIDEAVLTDLRRRLEVTRGRPPADGELEEAVDHWIRDEVLVREARRLGLDRGDATIRAHLVDKMAYVHRTGEADATPDEAELRAFYDAHAERYARDDRVTVRQLFVSADAPDATERAARLAQRVADGEPFESVAADADPPPGGPVLRGRTAERLVELYGDAFSERATTAAEGVWTTVDSPLGVHVIRVEERTLGGALPFEQVRTRVAAHWQRTRTAEGAREAFEEARSRYEVVGWPR